MAPVSRVLERQLLQQVRHTGGLRRLVDRARRHEHPHARRRARDVLGGDAGAVGERGDAGGEAGELVGEARREVEPGQGVQERGRARGRGCAGEPPRRRRHRRRHSLDLAAPKRPGRLAQLAEQACGGAEPEHRGGGAGAGGGSRRRGGGEAAVEEGKGKGKRILWLGLLGRR